MQILNKLTLKHLKMNKKRTMVTIIGITLSCALMVGIGLLCSSFIDSMKLDAINTYGSYHAKIDDLNKKEVEMIEANASVERIYYTAPLGFARISTTAPHKPYAYVNEASPEFLNTLQLIEGELPKNSTEIVISSAINIYDGALQVGDAITLDIGTRVVDGEELPIAYNYQVASSWDNDTLVYQNEELNITKSATYKIVGIFDSVAYEEYYSGGFLVYTLNNSPKDIYSLYIEYKNPRKTYELTDKLISNLSLEDKEVKINSNLLYYYGATKYDNINDVFIPLIVIALLVIGAGCTIVIYNSFAISTMERKKSFGLYSSIGATNKQLLKTVLFEALIVGSIGIILGLIGGFLGIFIVIKILNYLLNGSLGSELFFSVNATYLIIPLIIIFLVIFISAIIPAIKASRVSPVEAIRGNSDIKISKKEVKTPKFVTKLFGIEGDIAYKNVKRNKKKYRITIISLFISIVMFNTFTSYLDYLTTSAEAFNYNDFDVSILEYNEDINKIKEDMQILNNKYDIASSRVILDYTAASFKYEDKSIFTSDYQNLVLNNFEDLSVSVAVIPNNDLKKLTKSEAVVLNEKYNTVYDTEVNSRQVSTFKVFNTNHIALDLTIENTPLIINDAEVINDVYGFQNTKNRPSIVLIIGESTYLDLGIIKEKYDSEIKILTSDYRALDEDIQNKTLVIDGNYEYSNEALNMASTRNIILAMKILFYGFIALVTLIGVTSVLNTINTSVNLRRKEFAMLRSVGLSPQGFNKMLFFESLFFGLKSLIYAIPVSLLLNYLIFHTTSEVVNAGMIINYKALILSVIGVFVIVVIAMEYSAHRIKKENILEALREENI